MSGNWEVIPSLEAASHTFKIQVGEIIHLPQSKLCNLKMLIVVLIYPREWILQVVQERQSILKRIVHVFICILPPRIFLKVFIFPLLP